ncbi:hypothetical protein PAAG_08756 [Paracoccidioides lutzii Pb01]|uniref:Uncharacterized protein n=1 Tax=Paracoccidioides lutzii (strain ATCC MYA-826 / Pb01) TaxID=502779 RepID=C1HDB5_PARBA|nr:hypothetical protein PAAG_08756 [Paracoccidioides lutzii Pb01]EEH39487.1 hypothetical protein PAAG_08756 [Paracoccidioides lutzii Pb01]
MDQSLEKETQHLQVTTGIREPRERLQEHAKKLRTLQRLEPRAANLLSAAVRIMTTEQTVRAFKIYRSFLHDVLRTCGQFGQGLVVLCAVGLGKHRVVALSEEKRMMLVHWVANNTNSLYFPALSSMATQFSVPNFNKRNPTFPGNGQYCSFSFVRRDMIENLPEPFRTALKASKSWKEEQERGGLAVTNCLSMYMPETLNEDALFAVRISYKDGWNICNLFGLGDPESGGDVPEVFKD